MLYEIHSAVMSYLQSRGREETREQHTVQPGADAHFLASDRGTAIVILTLCFIPTVMITTRITFIHDLRLILPVQPADNLVTVSLSYDSAVKQSGL